MAVPLRARGRGWSWAAALLAGALCRAAEVSAEPVGSPASILKKGKWLFGLVTGGFPVRELDGGADTAMFQVAHTRGYGLTDWLSIYGKLGVAYLELDDPLVVKEGGSTTHRFGAHFISGGQVKVKFFESKRHRWEWDGSVQYTDVRRRHRGKKNEVRFHDWQFATGLAKSLGRFKPYAGVKYSIVDMTFRARQGGVLLKQGEHESEHSVGFFVGTDFSMGQYEDVVINVESGYVDGAEVVVSLAHNF
jgi:hypothetical protein